jgi:hypothetical protein
VIQENRSVDDLMNGFCVNATICADTVLVDPVTGTQLKPTSLAAPFEPSDSHNDFVLEAEHGWNSAIITCKPAQNPCPYTAFTYVPAAQTRIYRQLASVDGVLSDATLGTEQGPGESGYLYAIAGQSGGYDADHLAIDGGNGTCSSSRLVPQINMTKTWPGTAGPKTKPCKNFQTIFDLLTRAGHSWRYYTHVLTDFRAAPEVIRHSYGSPNVVSPETRFLTDAANGALADVSFVTAAPENSDHPTLARRPLAGPRWVARVVNAVGETPFWNNTVIVVFWDDWGGFFDHVTPLSAMGPGWLAQPDPFEYGFRVPLIVASAYARTGTIDHTLRTYVSALRLIENTFKLPSLGTTDRYEPDALDSMLNYSQQPTPFTPLR